MYSLCYVFVPCQIPSPPYVYACSFEKYNQYCPEHITDFIIFSGSNTVYVALVFQPFSETFFGVTSLVLYHLFNLHTLISGNALWLAAFGYANSYLFHY